MDGAHTGFGRGDSFVRLPGEEGREFCASAVNGDTLLFG